MEDRHILMCDIAADPMPPPTAPCLEPPAAAVLRPGRGATWHEIILNHEQAVSTSISASVAAGHSLLVIEVSSALECERLAAEATVAAGHRRETCGIAGLVRQPVKSILGSTGSALCDELLLRQLALLQSTAAPGLTSELFGDALISSPGTCIHNPSLAWSEGEPAINVYTSGGCFTPHEDDQSITLLLNLSQRAAYTGGGTAFWSLEDGGGPGKGPTLPESQLPSHLIAPAVGTALIFGGQVTHAARPVLTGERIVFVASFSPVSRKGPKRTRALQAGLAGLRIAAARQAGGHPGSRQREFGTPSPDGAAPSPEAEHASAAAPSSATMEDTSLEELCRALSRSEEAALREPPAMAWMLAHEEEVD